MVTISSSRNNNKKKRKNLSVQFVNDDTLTTTIPETVLDPYWNPFRTCEEDEFCKGLIQKILKNNKENNTTTANFLNPRITLQCSARIIQRFIRLNIPHWRKFNNKKTRFVEEMDDVLVIKKGELERVSDFLVEMKREAKFEVAMELGIDEDEAGGGEEEHETLKAQIEDYKLQIQDLGSEKIKLRRESDDLQKLNKQIALETFGLYEKFTQESVAKNIRGMESEQQRLGQILEQYQRVNEHFEGMIQQIQIDIHQERHERQQFEQCIDDIISHIRSSSTKKKAAKNKQKKKLIGSLLEMKSSLTDQLEEYGVIPTIEV